MSQDTYMLNVPKEPGHYWIIWSALSSRWDVCEVTESGEVAWQGKFLLTSQLTSRQAVFGPRIPAPDEDPVYSEAADSGKAQAFPATKVWKVYGVAVRNGSRALLPERLVATMGADVQEALPEILDVLQQSLKKGETAHIHKIESHSLRCWISRDVAAVRFASSKE